MAAEDHWYSGGWWDGSLKAADASLIDARDRELDLVLADRFGEFLFSGNNETGQVSCHGYVSIGGDGILTALVDPNSPATENCDHEFGFSIRRGENDTYFDAEVVIDGMVFVASPRSYRGPVGETGLPILPDGFDIMGLQPRMDRTAIERKLVDEKGYFVQTKKLSLTEMSPMDQFDFVFYASEDGLEPGKAADTVAVVYVGETAITIIRSLWVEPFKMTPLVEAVEAKYGVELDPYAGFEDVEITYDWDGTKLGDDEKSAKVKAMMNSGKANAALESGCGYDAFADVPIKLSNSDEEINLVAARSRCGAQLAVEVHNEDETGIMIRLEDYYGAQASIWRAQSEYVENRAAEMMPGLADMPEL